MKHIVFVIGHYKNGGVAMRTTNLANEIATRGYQVTILVTKEIAKECFFELHEQVELVNLEKFKEENIHKDVVKRDYFSFQLKIKLFKLFRYIFRRIKRWDKKLETKIRCMRKGQILRSYMLMHKKAIYIPFGVTYYEQVYYAAEGLGCKIIYAERNAPQVELPNEEEARRMLQLLKNADGAVFQTKEERNFYNKYMMRNTMVIHNPIKKDLPEPYVGYRRKTIVNFCRVSKQKNLALLVDAFRKLHEEYQEYTLEIYGNTVEESEVNLKEELKQYVERLGLQQCVMILPPRHDVHQKVRDCAMFVSSSDFEGLSNSMIEAMAIGLPCICTDCQGGGASEMIQNERNGLLVPLNDVEALYNAMKRVIDNPVFAEECGREASKVREDLSVQKIVDEWLKVINNV